VRGTLRLAALGHNTSLGAGTIVIVRAKMRHVQLSATSEGDAAVTEFSFTTAAQ
jgi:hypothetical protein